MAWEKIIGSIIWRSSRYALPVMLIVVAPTARLQPLAGEEATELWFMRCYLVVKYAFYLMVVPFGPFIEKFAASN